MNGRPIAIKSPSSIEMAEVIAQCLKNGDQKNVIMFDCEPLIEFLRMEHGLETT